jgi:hypothetical protein
MRLFPSLNTEQAARAYGTSGLFPDVLSAGQLAPKPAEQLIDYHQVKCGPVRDILVRYLKERAAALDHASVRNLATSLAGLSWADTERHHPGHRHHPPAAWGGGIMEQRLRTFTAPDGTTRERKNYLIVRAVGGAGLFTPDEQ